MVSRTIEVPSGGSSSPLRASHNVPESPGTSSRQAHEEREHAKHLNAPLNAKQATDSATLARSDGTPRRRSTRDRVLTELRRNHNPGLGKFPWCISAALGLSEATVRRHLNALVAEGQARRIGFHDACYQWRAPKYGPITASEAASLAGQAALKDHHYLLNSAGELVRGGNLAAAHAELDRAAERYRAYLATLPEGEVAE